MPDPASIALHESKVVLHMMPKAGSSSILRSLLNAKKVVTDKVHLKKHFHYLTFDEFKDYSHYKNILICREPFDRFVSGYTNKVLKTNSGVLYKPLHKYGIKYQCPVDIFFNIIKNIPDSELDLHFRSQHYKVDKIPNLLIWKSEESESWWEELSFITGYNLKLLRENKALVDKPTISEDLKRAIKERFKEDYRFLGYEF